MRKAMPACWLLVYAIGLTSAYAVTTVTSDMPHLEEGDGITKLIVDGRPFICVAGEVRNTSSSDFETTKRIIARLARCNLSK